MEELQEYKYQGARSLVLLHGKHIRSFVEIWLEAKKMELILPDTDDADYASLESLLVHVLNSSRNYIKWICRQLNLPDPGIKPPPEKEFIAEELSDYINHLLEKWSLPLAELEENFFFGHTYVSNWGTEYCIEAMLEHAVMHPIRHEFQLSNLMKR